MKSQAKYFYLKFIKKEQLTKDVFSFYFNRTKLNFLAGQYIHLYLPIANEKGRGNSRMFTITSSPLEKHIVITTKKGMTIFKKNLFNLNPQSPVKFYGPSGSLILNETQKPYVFLSQGIGITPFISIMKYAVQKKLNTSITLLASFSKREDFLFRDELLDLSKSNPNIKIIYTLGRITPGLIKKYIKNIKKHLYYIVGSPQAVLELEEIAYEAGISSENIFVEDFEGY